MTDSIIFVDPITGKYTISAPKRKKRPFQSSGTCPFCVGSDEVKEEFDGIISLPNKFAALSPDNAGPDYGLAGRGVCEVILYSSNHHFPLRDRPVSFIADLLLHLQQRVSVITENHNFVEYIFPFENYGKEIGVSMEHPHGQLYALPIVPDIIKKKMDTLKRNSCIYCGGLNDYYVIKEYEYAKIVVPRYAQWPIQLHIIPVQHIADLGGLILEVINDLARCMKECLLGIHEMYSKEIPYIMSFYQSPVGVNDFHFHIEIISPQISEEKFKFRAGLETSLDIFINSTDMRDFVSKIKDVML